jgi:hypothetical protein
MEKFLNGNPGFSLYSAARVGGRTETMSQKGPFLRLHFAPLLNFSVPIAIIGVRVSFDTEEIERIE